MKVFYVIFLSKYSYCLCTSELQFGFKQSAQRGPCLLYNRLREDILGATKAFDHVDYCKLFRQLLRRDLPAIFVCVLHFRSQKCFKVTTLDEIPTST